MRAPRVAAVNVRIGDQILSPYYPRTWQRVEAVLRDTFYDSTTRSVGLDTPRDRTWWEQDELVPCRQSESKGLIVSPNREQG